MGLFDLFRSAAPDPDIPVVKKGTVQFKGTEFPLCPDTSELPEDAETLEAMRRFFAATSLVREGNRDVNVFPAKYKKYKNYDLVHACEDKLAFVYYPRKDLSHGWGDIYMRAANKLLRDSSFTRQTWGLQFILKGFSLNWQHDFAQTDRFIHSYSGDRLDRMDDDVQLYLPEAEKHLAELMDAVSELVIQEKRRGSGIVPGFYFARELISLKKMGIDCNGLRFRDSLLKGAQAGDPYCMGYVGALDAKRRVDVKKAEEAALAGDYLCVVWMTEKGPREKQKQMMKKREEMERTAHKWLRSVSEAKLRDRLMDELQQIDRDRVNRERFYADGLRLIRSENAAERAGGAELLEKAAALGNPLAVGQLCLFRAEQGDAAAQVKAGESYLEGRYGLEKDHARAAEMFRRAAEQHNGLGCARLAECHLYEWGVTPDFYEATRLLQAAVEFATADDAGEIARLLATVEDIPGARALYRKAMSVNVTDQASAERLRRDCRGYVDLLVSRNGLLNEDVHEVFLAALDYLALSPLVREVDGFQEELRPAAQGNPTAIKRLSSSYRYYYHTKGQKIETYNNVILMALHMELIRLYTREAEQGNIEACYKLWLEYSVYPPTAGAGNRWAWQAIEASYPPMLYSAYLEAHTLGISEYRKMEYLREAAQLGDQSAILELEVLKMEAEEAQRRAAERRRTAEAEAERARQSRLDWAERDFDLMTGGTGYTMEEKAMRGDISAADYMRHRNFRDTLG